MKPSSRGSGCDDTQNNTKNDKCKSKIQLSQTINSKTMPHPNKKQRLTGDDASLAEARDDDDDQMMAASVGDLSTDVLANIFRFLHVEDIMRQRGVNKKWGEYMSDILKAEIDPKTNFPYLLPIQMHLD